MGKWLAWPQALPTSFLSYTQKQEMVLLKHKLEPASLLKLHDGSPQHKLIKNPNLILPPCPVSPLKLPPHPFRLVRAHPQVLLLVSSAFLDAACTCKHFSCGLFSPPGNSNFIYWHSNHLLIWNSTITYDTFPETFGTAQFSFQHAFPEHWLLISSFIFFFFSLSNSRKQLSSVAVA